MASRWTDAALIAARKDGDPEGDALVERILTARPGGGTVSRGGYNHLLDLANVLVAHPELALVKSTLLRQGLDDAGEVAAFFEPMEAPDWVDEEKLALAGRLWQTDSILAIAVLYAASLPACYLMKKGVPALYQTEKLAEHKYVFQRIYETGLMLDGVMHPGGINVMRDAPPSPDAMIANVMNMVDPDGRWEWRNHRLHRAAGEGGPPPSSHAVSQELATAHAQAKRYIWGGGFIAARKVRFLHASMRLMLMNPQLMRASMAPDGAAAASGPAPPSTFMEQASRRTAAWDVDELGKPINQEDLAFVLLTFSYLIPKGMEAWGRKVTKEQKEAFLHLWRVVGHVMGIRDDLMTDQWDEAGALYEQILKRNGGTSGPGQILTTAVMDFLRSYLPARFNLNKVAPAALIVDQLGPQWAQMILSKEDYAAATRPTAKMTLGLAKTGLRIYYWLRQHVLGHLPFIGPTVANLTEHAAETLIDSWRDSFRRKPFYIPSTSTTWVMERGVTPEFEASLMQWRQKVFDTLAAGLVSFIGAGFAFGLALLFFFLDMASVRNVALGVSVVGFAAAIWLLTMTLPAVAKTRPKLQD